MKNYVKKIGTAAALLPYSAMAAVPDFGQIADNLRNQYDNIVYFLTATTYVLGIYYILHAIVMLKTMRASTMDGGLVAEKRRSYWVELGVGVVLLFFPSVLAIIEATIFGSFNAVTAGIGGIIYS